MADRLASDHPSVTTVRATLTETTTGVRLEVPADERDRLPIDEVVHVACDGTELFAKPERALDGDDVHLTGLYESPRFARDPRDGDDRLPSWCSDHGIRTGGSILLDVVEPNFLYGLRAPGETAYYDAREPPADSLKSIANGLESSEANAGSETSSNTPSDGDHEK